MTSAYGREYVKLLRDLGKSPTEYRDNLTVKERTLFERDVLYRALSREEQAKEINRTKRK